jgi:spore maturation protein CgeB
MQGSRVQTEDTVKIFNAAKINLNLHSSLKAEEAVTHGDFVNPRTFEIAACGAFQLVDERTHMPELFTPEEMATFGSMEDLKAKLEYYFAHPEERERIAGLGRSRVLAEHTYAGRMRALLDFAKERLPSFPKNRDRVAWPEGVSEKLVPELSALMETLALPVDSDFEQVITALRQRSGKLAPLESALLFLDEWKKQYKVQ